MNKTNAKRRIRSLFGSYKGVLHRPERAWLNGLTKGKVYELYCLSNVVESLRVDYGYTMRFVGSSIVFKMKGGPIRPADPHFVVSDVTGSDLFKVFTDIEFETLGKHLATASGSSPVTDRSAYHELDIVVVNYNASGRPTVGEIALGVECKAQKFKKSIVKEILGVRREMSFVSGNVRSALSALSPRSYVVDVPANPPSEYWLAYTAADGRHYVQSPQSFGIRFIHWCP